MNIIEYIAENGYYNTLEKLAQDTNPVAAPTPAPLTPAPRSPALQRGLAKLQSIKQSPTVTAAMSNPTFEPTPEMKAQFKGIPGLGQ